jgi:transcriptional regulator with XRE-family HTH domain
MGINEFVKIGDKIKTLRKDLGLTQEEMAKKLYIPRSTYANYESNKREPSSDIIYKICEILNISPYKLIGDNSQTQYSIDSTLEKDSTSFDTVSEDRVEYDFKSSSKLAEHHSDLEQQNDLYKLFNSFFSSKTLQKELNYTENDIIEYVAELLKFTLEMLNLKIKNIKYEKLVEKKESDESY